MFPWSNMRVCVCVCEQDHAVGGTGARKGLGRAGFDEQFNPIVCATDAHIHQKRHMTHDT